MNSPEWERPFSAAPLLDIRFGIPLGAKRFYLAINAGRERRDREMREVERIVHPILKPWNMLFSLPA